MSNPRKLKVACVALLLLTSAGSASACEVWRDEFTKVWRGNCNLTIDPKGPQIVQSFIDGASSPPMLKMPDLTIHKFKFILFGHDLEVYADVRNIGAQSSSATNLGVSLTVVDPLSIIGPRIVPLPVATVPALASTATARIFLGIVNVDTSVQDWDIATSGMVDQVTVAQPVRGSVIESNETNNGLIYLCRVFGPTPNTSLQGCD